MDCRGKGISFRSIGMDLRLVHYDEAVLRKEARPVSGFDARLRELADAMLEVMWDAEGIGLAAQQVDHLESICVVDLGDAGPEVVGRPRINGKAVKPARLFPLVLINPGLISHSAEVDDYEEGCLSFPGIRGKVRRPVEIGIQYQDLQGRFHQLEAQGLLARCIQHEMDHLRGVLFIDHLRTADHLRLRPRLRQLKKETRQNRRMDD